MIAKDKGGEWHFVSGERDTYVCLNDKGEQIGKIYAEYVPDPISLWKQKAKFEEVDINSPKGQMLKPNKVVFDLHKHARVIADEKRKDIKDKRNADNN